MGCGMLSKLKPVHAPNQVLTTVGENKMGDEKQDVHVMMTAFSNELIWKTLSRCLNISDLKCCRLVNRKLNQMVMDETNFKDRVVLNVEEGKLTPEDFEKTEENWKKIGLHFPVEDALNPSNYEYLYPLLKEVEFMSLRLHGSVPSTTTIDFHPLLGRLLSSCTKLKSLALEPDFILTGSGIISEGMETLETLEQLEILKPDDAETLSQMPEPEQFWNMQPAFVHKLRNVKVYKTYFPVFRLDPSSFGRDVRSGRTWLEAIFVYGLCETIVENNRQHIRSHAFYDINNMCAGEDSRVPLTFSDFETPALKALEVDCYTLQLSRGIASFINYLDSRPSLQQLDITCHNADPEDSSLLSDLIHSVARHGPSLKKLTLWMTLDNLSDWKFLGQSRLQLLHLVDCGTNEWIRVVMANLPKSIEKLFLKGALPKREQKKLIPPTVPLKIKYFARLNPLLVTQLSIFNAGGLVDNQVAEFICKNFKMLRKFDLSEAETDDRGFREIAGLKGLQFLTLETCGISDKTLKLIRFLELRYLDITDNPETTVSGIKMAMKECPSLETLLIPHAAPDFTKEDGKKICPRLKFLFYVYYVTDSTPEDE